MPLSLTFTLLLSGSLTASPTPTDDLTGTQAAQAQAQPGLLLLLRERKVRSALVCLVMCDASSSWQRANRACCRRRASLKESVVSRRSQAVAWLFFFSFLLISLPYKKCPDGVCVLCRTESRQVSCSGMCG